MDNLPAPLMQKPHHRPPQDSLASLASSHNSTARLQLAQQLDHVLSGRGIGSIENTGRRFK
eukprot:2450408-Prorocentrum_lima.AAC.1